jgi:hypothetical protein
LKSVLGEDFVVAPIYSDSFGRAIGRCSSTA